MINQMHKAVDKLIHRISSETNFAHKNKADAAERNNQGHPISLKPWNGY